MAVVLDGISKSFGAVHAVVDLDLTVESGELLSLVGPSGCGKTTVLRMIAGFLTPDTGTVAFDGRVVNDVPARQRKVGIVFQDYALFPNLTVFENVAFGLRAAGRPLDAIRPRVAELLELVHLFEVEQRYPRELSGGQKQRVALARALAIEPQLLLLDEPLSALDAKVRLNLRYELRRIQRETGTTTIYVTHDQEEAMSVSDHVAVMHQGRIEQIGPPDDVYKRPITPFVADFIGTSTALEVRESQPKAGLVTWRDVTLRTRPYEAKGTERLLLVRPENLSVDPADDASTASGGPNRLVGIVTGIVFLGAAYRCAVEVDDQRFLADVPEAGMEHVRYGERVTLAFEPDGAWLL